MKTWTIVVVGLVLAGCASVREQGRTVADDYARLCRVMIETGQATGRLEDCESRNADPRSPGGTRVPGGTR